MIEPPAYRARLQFANHEMVDKLLQQESLTPSYLPGECPMRYYERRNNLLKRLVGLLLLALPQSLQELEEAAWDDDLENNFFRPGGIIPVINIITTLLMLLLYWYYCYYYYYYFSLLASVFISFYIVCSFPFAHFRWVTFWYYFYGDNDFASAKLFVLIPLIITASWRCEYFLCQEWLSLAPLVIWKLLS